MLIDVAAQTKSDISLQWIEKIGKLIIQKEASSHQNHISIILADDAFITNLNHIYFHKDNPTDVISFFLGEDIFPGEKNTASGEVYISLERARQQAREYRVTYHEEVARLIIHGILHLMGYDDQTEQDQKEMTVKENLYLSQITFKE